MSRRDTYHYVVKNALIREGWTITHDPYYFEIEPKLSSDIGAERTIAAEKDHEKIVVEVKSFRQESQVVELEKAMGQYGIYQDLLHDQDPDREFYLAVPFHAFNNVFSKKVGKIALRVFGVNLIIYSLSEDEPLVWKKR